MLIQIIHIFGFQNINVMKIHLIKHLSLFVSLFLVFTLSSCCKNENYLTTLEGGVINRSNSSVIPEASVKLMHYSGSKCDDTVCVLTKVTDSVGEFYFEFESNDDVALYWVIAEKDGYGDSSWDIVDIDSKNSYTIKLSKLDD